MSEKEKLHHEMTKAELYDKELPLYREKLIAARSQIDNAFCLINWAWILLNDVIAKPSLLKDEDWIDEIDSFNKRTEKLLK
jgi:hypothetical protein